VGQHVALGVERFRLAFHLIGAVGKAGDLLANQKLSPLPPPRLRHRSPPRRFQRHGATI
jgi:hypothetical protein